MTGDSYAERFSYVPAGYSDDPESQNRGYVMSTVWGPNGLLYRPANALELDQQTRGAITEALAAKGRAAAAQWAAHPELAAYAAQGYDFDSAQRLYQEGYDTTGYGGAAALAKNLATAAANPLIVPWSPGVSSGPVRGTTVLPGASGPTTLPADVAIGRPFRETRPVLSDSSAPQDPRIEVPVINFKGDTPPGGSDMSLGSLLGNAAKNVLQSLPGGAILTAGATALLNSRRDTPPSAPAGMPMVQQPGGLLNLPNPILHPIDYVTQYGQSVAQAGQVLLQGPGGLGAVNPTTKSVSTKRCPRGYALAIDGKCYPKSMLSRQLRKWKPEPKPVVSRSDQKAIRRAATAKHRLVKITKDAGAFASLHKPHANGGSRTRGHKAGCKCVVCSR